MKEYCNKYNVINFGFFLENKSENSEESSAAVNSQVSADNRVSKETKTGDQTLSTYEVEVDKNVPLDFLQDDE